MVLDQREAGGEQRHQCAALCCFHGVCYFSLKFSLHNFNFPWPPALSNSTGTGPYKLLGVKDKLFLTRLKFRYQHLEFGRKMYLRPFGIFAAGRLLNETARRQH